MRVNELYEIAVEHGLDVLVMEPLKGGALINLPEDAKEMLKQRDPDASIASWGLRFAASLDAVKIVNSGMNRMSDMIDNVETFTDFKPLSEEEFKFLEEVSKTVRSKIAVACSYCKYCVEHCPNDIYLFQITSACTTATSRRQTTPTFSITASSHRLK